ncbi:hypothetical protein D9M73_221290 [compost metagenome]
MHRHEGFIDQRVVRLRVLQRTGNRQHTVAAAEVGNPGVAQVAGQMRQEGAGADVQAFAAEHVGMVEQFDCR